MAMLTAMHHAGVTALGQLLQGNPPGTEEREIPCPCGSEARSFCASKCVVNRNAAEEHGAGIVCVLTKPGFELAAFWLTGENRIYGPCNFARVRMRS
jgi:hypothetical protein